MKSNFRNKDLTEVFDERWKANHNDAFFQKKKEEQQAFANKLFKPTNNKVSGYNSNNGFNNNLRNK